MVLDYSDPASPCGCHTYFFVDAVKVLVITPHVPYDLLFSSVPPSEIDKIWYYPALSRHFVSGHAP